MMTGAEAGGMQPQSKECRWPLGARRGQQQSLSQNFRKEHSRAHTLHLTQ